MVILQITVASARPAPVSVLTPGVDLTVDIYVDPPFPGPGEEVDVTVVVKNQGDTTAAAGFYTYLYIDPVDQPPTGSTGSTTFWYLPSMAAGGQNTFHRMHTFTTTGCDHVIYVWVDKTGTVAESDESNNLVSEIVCVGVTCMEDPFEVDDVCSSSSWLMEGVTQTHSLCPKGTVPDQDWVKFTAVAGVTYTIDALNLEAHADPLLYLYESCDSLYQFGMGPHIAWQAPTSGVYYVQVEHRQPPHGPLAGYDLVMSTGGGPGDIYEPDDDCGTARDIPTDGFRQTHLFQDTGDRDWVKFTVGSGESFAIIADHTGTGVNPLISLYSSCGQALNDAEYVSQAGEILASASTGQTYYAEIRNQDPNIYGSNAHYDVRVEANACVGDGYEPDNTPATATSILTTGASQTHNTCPAGDVDWITFTVEAGTTYVLQTQNLGMAADTHLYLYDTDGATELAHNDDYGYTVASRIIWQAPSDGTYYAKVRHHNPNAGGVDTSYDLAVSKGVCVPDAYEGDNGVFDAPQLTTDGTPQSHSFCADPLSLAHADQDWVRFEAVAGAHYLIETSDLEANSDTVLHLYDSNGTTLLASNDDHGVGGASAISVTAPHAGTFYVRVTHYNSGVQGSETAYTLSAVGESPPTPTPTPTPTPIPSPTPPPPPPPSEVETLIVINRRRFEDLYGPLAANDLLIKLYELADHASVKGLVIQVEQDATAASAYDAWKADATSLVNTTKANAVAASVRNLVMSFLDNNLNVKHIVLVGDDRIIPHRRVLEGALSKPERDYAVSITANSTQWAACQDNMILTDDYYADRVPTTWQGQEIYLPDFAIGRLIEHPSEITAMIDAFLADDVTAINKALVAGYDFVQDSAGVVSSLFKNDEIATDDALIGYSWSGVDFRDKHLNAAPRFDVQSINGHANHVTEIAPDNDNVTASEVSTATADLSGALIFSVGCHAGLNDAGVLDLPQAFARQRANYVGNTGYGWGGGGIVYSEALMRNYARDLLRDTTAQIGPALMAAKHRYYERAATLDAYDVKVLMQVILYGFPMAGVTSGGTLSPEDPFPSAGIVITAPTALGDVNVGSLAFGVSGAFGENEGEDGSFLDLDTWTHFSAGEPIQPRFFADASSLSGGDLHGAVFLGGTYTDTPAFDPVVALPVNEYVASTGEPAFSAAGWYPPVPFAPHVDNSVLGTADTLVAVLGQYNAETGTERVYTQMTFETYYTFSSDVTPPTISHIDSVLEPGSGLGRIKVEAGDASDILRVIVAYTDGAGTWQSRDLDYDTAMVRWTGVISAITETQYFVQVVDGAGNVATDVNKDLYYGFTPPLPLIGDGANRIFLPVVLKGGAPIR
jgi:hypothetical protein